MAAMKLKILAVVGSTHADSVTRVVVSAVGEELRKAGCEVDLLDLSQEPLALFNPETAYGEPGFAGVKARVEQADVFILGTPDYHGSMSGALKNFLDHFWREFAGKLFATIVASHEKGLTVTDQFVSDSFQSRLGMLVRDTQVYGGLLAQQRRADLAGTDAGFMARLRK